MSTVVTLEKDNDLDSTPKSLSKIFLLSFKSVPFLPIVQCLIIIKSVFAFNIPANTIQKIVIAVPEKAEYEKGFYRWINRIARMSADLGCQAIFYASETTNHLILRYMRERHKNVRTDYEILESWNDFPALRHELTPDQLFVVVTARRGSISYQKAFDKLPQQLQTDFASNNLMLIYPDQQEENNEIYDFIDPHHYDTPTSSTRIGKWLSKWIGEMG